MVSYRNTEDHDLLSAYAFRTKPKDLIGFRNLTMLGGRLGPVTTACFLLYPQLGQSQTNVYDFLFRVAPILLHQLSRTTEPRRLVMYNRVRGKVDWSKTYKTRYSQENNPTLFVCSQSWRLFDRLENQLFKYLLHQVQVCLDQASPYLKNWYAWGSKLRSRDNNPLMIGDSFASLAHQVRKLRNHVYLQAIELPPSLRTQHIAAARASKNELYGPVADLGELYRLSVEAPDWFQWNELLGQTLPLPPSMKAIGSLLSS